MTTQLPNLPFLSRSLFPDYGEMLNEAVTQLLYRQVRLDPDCERVLRENLWNLYST